MKFHIVGTNESIQEIIDAYDITLEELKKENKHIRVWNNLIPGTKLKIPVITESMNEELNSTEPFIEDYYPKIRIDNEKYETLNEELEEVKIDQTQENVIEEVNKEEPIKEFNEIEEKKEIIEEPIKERPNSNRYYIPYPSYQMYPYSPIIYVIKRPKRN